MSTQLTSGQAGPTAQTESRQRLRAFSGRLPQRPGVYIMKDASGAVIYVGKAVNLRRRVGSYATPSAGKDRKVSRLVSSIRSLSYVEVCSELEALLVESRLIKAYLPAFNRQLIDPESCCFLRADFTERLPRIEVVRFRVDNHADYLGPFWHSSFVHDASEAVANAFRLRRCSGTRDRHGAVCILCDLGKCSGPCKGRISDQDYRSSVSAAWDSLAGRSPEAGQRLAARRDRLADQLRFEDAHTVHRQIRALEQIAASVPYTSQLQGNFALVVPSYMRGRPVVLIFRAGRLMNYSLSGPLMYPDPEMIAERLVRACRPAGDMLPGTPSLDDQLIIHSYLNRRGIGGVVVPLITHKPVIELARSIHSAIGEIRQG